MELDPALIAVAGTLSTVAVALYRSLLRRAERAEEAEKFWMDRALTSTGLAEIATEVARRKRK